MNWEQPKTPIEIRSFLGLAGYYRRFIQDFTKIASSFTKLTRKNAKFEWGEDQDIAFQILKQRLSQALRGQVIAYASKQLKKHEEENEKRHSKVCRTMSCLQVKTEDQQPYGKLQPLEIPVWKWEKITMNLIMKLPKTPRQCDAIWVIVNRLTKSTIFLPIKESMSLEALAELYLREVVARHGVLVFIVSDRDNIFTSIF
ncbi:putative reverse transcriptase domain-containing protein [Tanacetum coccineum]